MGRVYSDARGDSGSRRSGECPRPLSWNVQGHRYFDRRGVRPRISLQGPQDRHVAELHRYGSVQRGGRRASRGDVPMTRFVHVAAALLILPAVQAQSRIDSSFQKFWAADSPSAAARATDEILKTGISFDDALGRLKRGRTYAAQKEGVVQLSRHTNGIVHNY